jgi:hypothetical protein
LSGRFPGAKRIEFVGERIVGLQQHGNGRRAHGGGSQHHG